MNQPESEQYINHMIRLTVQEQSARLILPATHEDTERNQQLLNLYQDTLRRQKIRELAVDFRKQEQLTPFALRSLFYLKERARRTNIFIVNANEAIRNQVRTRGLDLLFCMRDEVME